MKFMYSDGGRAEAGYKGSTGDCVCRAISIATGQPYQTVYDALNTLALNTLAKKHKKKSSARTGVYKETYYEYLVDILGWVWVPTMKIGSGCKVHLANGELPMGNVIARVSKHLVAVIDGVIYDTHDPSRGGTRCVYGYFIKNGLTKD